MRAVRDVTEARVRLSGEDGGSGRAEGMSEDVVVLVLFEVVR